jgi:predicted nucleotidyltransferase
VAPPTGVLASEVDGVPDEWQPSAVEGHDDAVGRSTGHDHGDVISRFTDACGADDRIVAAFLAGSYATGTADAHSDLDLGVITTDEAFADVIADRRALISQLGTPLFLDHFFRAWNVFFILADGTEGEIFFGREGALEEIDIGPFEPLLDKRGILAGAEFAFSPLDPGEQREKLRQIVNWFWHELSHFIAALGRGDLWWAYGQLESLRGHCVNVMRIQHGAEAQDEPYEKLAKAIPVSELASLRTTFCLMERQAMLDAALVIVRFFREHAPRVAKTHGSEYPAALAQLFSDRLDELDAASKR